MQLNKKSTLMLNG